MAGGKERVTSRPAEPPTPRIEDLKAGSEVAWNDAVRALGPPLRAFIALRGAPDPDGVLGDVFLDLSRGIDRVEGGWPNVRTLAFVIARRRLVDGVRAALRRPVQPVDTATLDAIPAGDVEQEAIDQLERRWVLDLLDILTPTQRDIITMRFVADLTIREVADITGSTQTAVKANQRRALASLRRHLDLVTPGSSDPRAVHELVDVFGGRS